jgi:hypothetical protein
MNPRKPGDDDSPTGEQEAIEFDGTQTIQLDDTYRFQVVCASESEAGGVDRDERGQTPWKWKVDATAADPAAETFDELKALDADLDPAIGQKVQELQQLEEDGNPYNTPGPKKPK